MLQSLHSSDPPPSEFRPPDKKSWIRPCIPVFLIKNINYIFGKGGEITCI